MYNKGLGFKKQIIMKKIVLFIFILFLWASIKEANAQSLSKEKQHKLDSLKTIISNEASHDTVVVNSLIEIVNYFYLQNPDTALVICEKAKAISERVNFIKGQAQSYAWLAYLLNQKGDYFTSLEYNLKSLEIYEDIGDKNNISLCLNSIGFIYIQQGDIPKGLEFYHKSLKIREETGDKKGMGYSLNNIGQVLGQQGETEESQKYYYESLKVREEIGDTLGIAYSLGNIGSNYIILANLAELDGDFAKRDSLFNRAIKAQKESLKLRKELGDKRGASYSLAGIGLFYEKQSVLERNKGDESKCDSLLEIALSYHLKSLKIREEIGYKKGIVLSLINSGSIEKSQGKLISAKNRLEKALEISQEIESPDLISRSSIHLSILAKKEHDFQKAYEMLDLHIHMRDSLNNESTKKAAIQQRTKYEYEKQKALDDAEHEKILALEIEEKNRQQFITYVSIGIVLLILFFLGFVFNRLKITQKQKMIIEAKEEETRRQKGIIEEKHREISDSINYAKRIQNAILPPLKLVKEYIPDSFILYKPKDVVAGDFYWMHCQPAGREQKENNILFAAADCTGHGVPGAMVSVVCNNGLNRSVREYGLIDPGKILDKTRDIVISEFRAGWQSGEKSEEEVKDGMDISLCALDFKNKTLAWAGANNPLWIIRNGEILETKSNKQPIGVVDNPQPFTTHKIELQKGDIIYVFTDGFQDQFGGERLPDGRQGGKKFKPANFKKLLLSICLEPMNKQLEIIDKTFEDWKGELEQLDDVCVIGVRL